MLGENHLLSNEFPDYSELIQSLKSSNSDFSAKARRYHELDHKIRGLEVNKVPTTDEHFSALKLERAELKDKIYHTLKAHTG
ncbi:YdcH family protein [Shewanella litorisediminis]|uniref:DUF465 domain-containing protein n=1 Tax=Shewanella litorisediminis TaxID=1173586 RepID=A0ABX7G025_9GAMM|nr:DUF465 domain-containing protein [Shewanella litorisediminis]MCL2918332.1 DUF465 domain-containing protein [Shewanella litorisediminis]QRH00621.1 DUF465 domain-containing protein [Shewanella litorisediminis]